MSVIISMLQLAQSRRVTCPALQLHVHAERVYALLYVNLSQNLYIIPSTYSSCGHILNMCCICREVF